MNLHSFTDELLSLQAPSEGLGKVASNIRPYSRLGGGAAVAGALEHKLTKMKEERDGMHPMLQRKGSTLSAAKRVGASGLGLAALLHLVASKGKKAK
jgi:hypothetical protein